LWLTHCGFGDVNNDYAGKSSEEMKEDIKVLLSFTKPESITAMIHSLIELQKAVFDGHLEVPERVG